MILFGGPSTNVQTSKNEEIVKSYINARNTYDVKKMDPLIAEKYLETFIDGSIEIQNKAQLLDRVLWGKELDTKIKLLSITSDKKTVTTIEENSNYLDVALKRKSRKFKIVYTFSDNKILEGYYKILRYNSEKYMKFVDYCEENKLIYNRPLNQEFGIHLRKILEKYKMN